MGKDTKPALFGGDGHSKVFWLLMKNYWQSLEV